MTTNTTAKTAKKAAPAPKKKAVSEKPAVLKAEKKAVAEKPVVLKAEKKVSKVEGRIKLQQTASSAGKVSNQINSLKGLGLNKVNKISEVEDTPSVRGMINKVKHLLRIIK